MELGATIRPRAGSVHVLLIDEHPLFVEALRSCILDIDGVSAFVCPPTGDLSEVAMSPIDLVICDPTLEGTFRTEILESVLAHFPLTHLMVLSSEGDSSRVTSALASGAQSYLLKSEPIETIRAAIELILCGGVALSRSVETVFVDALIVTPIVVAVAGLATRGLSPREIEVMALVARGYSDSEIARLLNISQRTAAQHVGNVLRKLDCRSRSEAVARVMGAEATPPDIRRH